MVEGKPSSSSSQVSSVDVADLVAEALALPDAEVTALVTLANPEAAAVAEPDAETVAFAPK